MAHRPCTGFLINYLDGDYQLGIMRGAEEVAIAQDENLVVAVGRWLQSPNLVDAVQNDIYQHLMQPGVDAIILATGCLSHYVSSDELRTFCAGFAPLPVVSISDRVPGVPSIVIDNRRGQQLVIEHLLQEHGCKRIAYMRGPTTSFEAEERLEGYKSALEEHGIAFDPELVQVGDFWIGSGAQGVAHWIDKGTPFDALAAANDYMALGAMDELKLRGIRVPQDLRIVGFDDIPSARMTSPSLTTVRQPLQRMGRYAYELLLKCRAGETVDEVHSFNVELVRRQSCGCGYRVSDIDSVMPPRPLAPLSISEFQDKRSQLELRLSDVVTAKISVLPPAIDALVSSLADELSGQRGRFVAVLGDILGRFETQPEILEQFYNLVAVLRTELRHRVLPDRSPAALDDLWHSATLMVGESLSRVQMRLAFEHQRLSDNLRASVERLSTVLNHASLSEALDVIIPMTAIKSACFGIYQAAERDRLEVIAAVGVESSAALRGRTYRATEIAPDGFIPLDHRSTLVLMPLSHAGTTYGQALFASGEHQSVYSMLREQIGSALKAAELHRNVVEETSRRERAERERLERDTEIAQQIQTAILPVSFCIPGLEVAAVMKPATTVGGDYYDAIATRDGCFLGIGDVTGHGLLAGMIMMMVQSMIAAGIRINERLKPSELLSTINRALFDNIRHRLHGDDHVTLTLIKYRRDGQLLLAGAHDEPLLYRRKTGRCECINSKGFWLAAVEEIAYLTTDTEVTLQDGDLLILYTDGVTEAMNESREQFGLQRLIATIEQHADKKPEQLCDVVIRACMGWACAQVDDVSLVIAKYQAE